MTCVPKQACESVGSCVYAQGQGASEDLFREGKDGGCWEGIQRGGVVRAEDGAHTGRGCSNATRIFIHIGRNTIARMLVDVANLVGISCIIPQSVLCT